MVGWADTRESYLAEIAGAGPKRIRDGWAYVLCLTTAARVDGNLDRIEMGEGSSS